jgi:hypothetical protein
MRKGDCEEYFEHGKNTNEQQENGWRATLYLRKEVHKTTAGLKKVVVNGGVGFGGGSESGFALLFLPDFGLESGIPVMPHEAQSDTAYPHYCVLKETHENRLPARLTQCR